VFGVTVAVVDLPYNQRMNRLNSAVAGGLLRVGRIYHEPAVRGNARGRKILDRFSGAQLVEVPSHWNIPPPLNKSVHTPKYLLAATSNA
jgi:hypothetical protein